MILFPLKLNTKLIIRFFDTLSGIGYPCAISKRHRLYFLYFSRDDYIVNNVEIIQYAQKLEDAEYICYSVRMDDSDTVLRVADEQFRVCDVNKHKRSKQNEAEEYSLFLIKYGINKHKSKRNIHRGRIHIVSENEHHIDKRRSHQEQVHSVLEFEVCDADKG